MVLGEKEIGENLFFQFAKYGDEEFINIKSKKKIKMVFCSNAKNRVFSGFPRIVHRRNNRSFGEEVYIQFWILEELESYDSKSPYSNMEFYLNKEEAISLFKEFIAVLENGGAIDG